MSSSDERDGHRVIDLRSDTVTRPGPEMREAIARAEVGDDVLGHDPTVQTLERRIAETLGKEAALFVPSGTMSNQIAIRLHCAPGSEVILHRGSHVLNYEAGAPAAVSGVGVHPLDGEHGFLDPVAVKSAIRPSFPHLPPTGLIWAENTHNTAGGTVWPLDRLDAVAAVAHDAGLPFHLDGARIWNASVACGETPARIAREADTITVCMSKGLGAPVGSLLVGPAELLKRGWTIRQQMGGGMRQSGILAAAALHALDHHFPKLAVDHANARVLAEQLSKLPGISIDLAAMRTNIVIFDVARTGRDPTELASALEERGVLVVPFGGTRLRAVTHLDVTTDDVRRAAGILSDVLVARAIPGGTA
jgi:threonine aldolase